MFFAFLSAPDLRPFGTAFPVENQICEALQNNKSRVPLCKESRSF
jgi:hypothetical protein